MIAPVADKALAELLARLLGGEHEADADGDYDASDLDQACGNAFRARQLVTLAECESRVAAAIQAAVDWVNGDCGMDEADAAELGIGQFIRAAAMGAKEGE